METQGLWAPLVCTPATRLRAARRDGTAALAGSGAVRASENLKEVALCGLEPESLTQLR